MLRLRPDQIELFEKEAPARFETRALTRIRAELGDLIAREREDRLRMKIRSGREKALTFGLRTDAEIFPFLIARILLGAEFDSASANDWVRQILDDESEPSMQRRAESLLAAAYERDRLNRSRN